MKIQNIYLIILLCGLLNSTLLSQLKRNIDFDFVVMNGYQPGLIKDDYRCFIKLDLKEEDGCKILELDYETTRWDFLDRTFIKNGYTLFNKSKITQGEVKSLIESFNFENSSYECKEIEDTDSDWELFTEEDTMFPLLLNEKYPFLLGEYSMAFIYNEDPVLLYRDKYCRKCTASTENRMKIEELCELKLVQSKIKKARYNGSNFYSFISDSIFYHFISQECGAPFDELYLESSVRSKKARTQANPSFNISLEGGIKLKSELLLETLKKVKFKKDSWNSSGYSFIQHYKNNLFIHYEEQYTDTTKQVLKERRTISIFPIYISQDFNNITLGISMNYLIFPFKDSISFYYEDDLYQQTQVTSFDDEFVLNSELSSLYFKNVEQEGKFGLKDMYNDDFYIPAKYDSIFVSGRFVVGYQNNQIEIYNNLFERISLDYKQIRDVYQYENNLLVLKNNELYWLNQNGKLQKKYTGYDYKRPGVCGNSAEYIFSINASGKSNYYLSSKSFYPYSNQDTTYYKEKILPDLVNVDELKFVNGNTVRNNNPFSNNGKYFPKGENYIFKQNDKYGIYSKVYNSYGFETKKDSLLFYGVDEFYPNKNEVGRPIQFRIGSKFHFFPLSRNAKFTKLGEFYYGYARFETTRGKKGWINLEGEEFYDE